MNNFNSKIFLFLIFLLGAINSLACSIQFDENYIKNELMAHGVSYNDLSLSSVSGLGISGFGKSFSADPGDGSCPEYLTVFGRVSMNHSPAADQSCSYSVTVKVKSYMGEEMLDGPIEEVTFENPEAACSTSISRFRVPIKKPVRVKRPIIVRHYP